VKHVVILNISASVAAGRAISAGNIMGVFGDGIAKTRHYLWGHYSTFYRSNSMPCYNRLIIIALLDNCI
jgi:hypothetical protein